MTPREKLIEKVAEIIDCQVLANLHLPQVYSLVAEAIIDYLKLEVIEKKGVKLLPIINIDNL